MRNFIIHDLKISLHYLLITPMLMFLILLVVILSALNKIEIVTTVISDNYNTPNNVQINKLVIKEGDNVKIGTRMTAFDNHTVCLCTATRCYSSK